jgi:hypothetical protein
MRKRNEMKILSAMGVVARSTLWGKSVARCNAHKVRTDADLKHWADHAKCLFGSRQFGGIGKKARRKAPISRKTDVFLERKGWRLGA